METERKDKIELNGEQLNGVVGGVALRGAENPKPIPGKPPVDKLDDSKPGNGSDIRLPRLP